MRQWVEAPESSNIPWRRNGGHPLRAVVLASIRATRLLWANWTNKSLGPGLHPISSTGLGQVRQRCECIQMWGCACMLATSAHTLAALPPLQPCPYPENATPGARLPSNLDLKNERFSQRKIFKTIQNCSPRRDSGFDPWQHNK